ncbi:MAG: WD40/YVTN/BNR-like repeat-containing protein, partial [Blastocatellia bacterium]
ALFMRKFISRRTAIRTIALSFLGLVTIAPAAWAAASHQEAAKEPVKIDSEVFSGLNARAIGPAVTGGRIAALDGVVEKGRVTLYLGSAGGGVWRSTNGGTTFKPIFDKYTQSIGAVTIDPSNSKTVWVGTGEAWTRNSVSVGTGIYKSTDSGENWEKIGLPDSEHIARILVDPKDSNTVYVAALGHLWNSNSERGLYKTTDGGKTWNKILSVNDDTGCASVAMDPQQSNILYAAMWQVRRRPWAFESGGPGSGLYKSTDSGATWKKLSGGLPTGELGRIGVDVAPSRPNRVYAIIESKHTAFYRSDDCGENWTEVNSSQTIVDRPFYFATLFIDPKDFNRVYKPGTGLVVSDDGGKTFGQIAGGVHSDFHAMWINPQNADQMFIGCDGGLYTSDD